MIPEGQQFAQYRIVRRLRSGGMGEVYLADDRQLHRHVAIKVIRTDSSFFADETNLQEVARLFLREAPAIARLDHPHILPLFDYGEEVIDEATVMYMVMPFRHEGSLADWLHKRGRARVLWPRDVTRIIQQAAEALQHAHNQYIIHQDVKPSNFLIHGQVDDPSQLSVQLADFGVAKFMTTTSESQTVRGTPIYMAPEQWEGHALPETDQYALAIMAYELLTGRPPFIGNNHQHLWRQHRYASPRSPRTINPGIPKDLDAVLFRALAKSPRQRYSSMVAFAEAFRHAVHNSGNVIPIDPTEEAIALIEASPEPTLSVPKPKKVVSLPSSKKKSIGKYILFSILITMLLIGSARFFYFEPFISYTQLSVNHTSTQKNIASTNTAIAVTNATATTESKATGTAQAIATSTAKAVNATATDIAQMNATATAQAAFANATATAQMNATATVYATTIAYAGAPLIDDPLQDNSQNYNWDTTSIAGGGGCTFTQGAYHASMPQKGYISACFAQATNFSNFAYQVQMKITKGDQGGIAFRADATTGSFYYFHINTQGEYALEVYSSYNSTKLITQNTSSAIKTGLNQTNLLTVTASGNIFTLFINMEQTISVSDDAYKQGQIGVVAEDTGDSTDIIFSSVKVWPLF